MKSKQPNNGNLSFCRFPFGFSIFFVTFVMQSSYNSIANAILILRDYTIMRSLSLFIPAVRGAVCGLCNLRESYALFFISNFLQMQSPVENCSQENNSTLSATSSERYSENDLQESFDALHHLSSIHGKETFGKLKQSLYEAIICFIESDLPLEGIRLSHVQDLHELHCFCDKMMGTDFDTIDLHLNALLS